MLLLGGPLLLCRLVEAGKYRWSVRGRQVYIGKEAGDTWLMGYAMEIFHIVAAGLGMRSRRLRATSKVVVFPHSTVLEKNRCRGQTWTMYCSKKKGIIMRCQINTNIVVFGLR